MFMIGGFARGLSSLQPLFYKFLLSIRVANVSFFGPLCVTIKGLTEKFFLKNNHWIFEFSLPFRTLSYTPKMMTILGTRPEAI